MLHSGSQLVPPTTSENPPTARRSAVCWSDWMVSRDSRSFVDRFLVFFMIALRVQEDALLDGERDAALPAVGTDGAGIDELISGGAERRWLADPGAADRIAAVLADAARHLRDRAAALVVEHAGRAGEALVEVRRRIRRRQLVLDRRDRPLCLRR